MNAAVTYQATVTDRTRAAGDGDRLGAYVTTTIGVTVLASPTDTDADVSLAAAQIVAGSIGDGMLLGLVLVGASI